MCIIGKEEEEDTMRIKGISILKPNQVSHIREYVNVLRAKAATVFSAS